MDSLLNWDHSSERQDLTPWQGPQEMVTPKLELKCQNCCCRLVEGGIKTLRVMGSSSGYTMYSQNIYQMIVFHKNPHNPSHRECAGEMGTIIIVKVSDGSPRKQGPRLAEKEAIME